MNRVVKVIMLLLICLVTSLSLFGCTRKNADVAQNSTNKTAVLSHSTVLFISTESKIYEVEISEAFDPALFGDKISDIPYRGKIASCYKIKDVSIDKAVAIKDEYGISKYKYLCEESFVWNEKSYKISYDDNNLGSEDKTHFGKNLGKIGNLQVFESTKDSSGKSLFVHPNGLQDEDGKNEYFLATEVVKN